MPARDLALEEEADHLALLVGLDLLAGDHDEVAAAREVGRLERAAEDVVVGDGDRAEALRLGVVDELGRVDRAVERPRGVHVQVGDDPRPVGERVGCAALRPPAALRQRRVELRRAARRRRRTSWPAAAARARSCSARAQRVVLGEPRDRCRRASSGCSSTPRGAAIAQPGRLRLEQHAREPVDARARRSRSRSAAPRARRRRARCARRTRAARSRGIAGRAIERLRPEQHRLPAGQLAERAQDARGRPARSFGRSSTTIGCRFGAGAKSSRSTPGRDELVVAGEALRRRVAHRLREGEQRVEPRRAASRAASARAGSRGGPSSRTWRP